MYEAFLGGNSVELSLDRLVRGTGMGRDELSDLLADYDVCGYVTLREADDGLHVSLTPSGCRTLGLRPLDGGGYGPADDRGCGRAAARAKREWAGDLKVDRSGYPLPTQLVGMATPWDNLPHPVCPHCRGGRLRPQAYCTYCDAWGLQDAPTPPAYDTAYA